MTPAELSVRFFLQLAVIVATCRGVGWMARRWLGQPQVVGEMIAGVILGPSLLGALAPELQAALFPTESKPILFAGAQLGDLCAGGCRRRRGLLILWCFPRWEAGYGASQDRAGAVRFYW